MKAIRVHQIGGPGVLTFEDVTDPVPAADDVLVENRAIGVNFIDTYFRSGLYPAPLPFIPGNEGAGVVVAVGSAVASFKPGDRVLYSTTIGSYAERRTIKATQLVKLPRAMPFEIGAAMMLKGLTAEYLLHRTFMVKPGHTVLVQAAAGGTGQILSRWAKHLGATVIGTVGSEDKAVIARACGCDHVINYRTTSFSAAVKDITNGALCDVVYDGVGKTTFPEVLDCLKPFGMFVSFGSASGPIDAMNIGILGQKGSLYAARPILFTHIANPATLQAMAKNLFKAYRTGAIVIAPPTRFALKDAAEAHRALEGRETTGSIILVP